MNTQAQPRVSFDAAPANTNAHGNLSLVMIAATFLCLVIALVIVHPLLSDTQTTQFQAPTQQSAQDQNLLIQDVEEPETTPVAEFVQEQEEAVTQTAFTPLATTLQTFDLSKINANDIVRPQFALFSNQFTPLDRVTSATIINQLRQPIRLIDTGAAKQDIPTLTADMLRHMSLSGQTADPRLTELIASAVLERQSDKYVRSLVNAIAAREPLVIPKTLRTTEGDWDTYSLLKAMAKTAGGPVPAPAGDVETNGFQRIVPGDSLARIALRYYGDPLKFDIILAANPQIDPTNPVLRPGDTIQMPKP